MRAFAAAFAFVVAVALAAGCAPSLPSSYHCATDAQCSFSGRQGRCEANGACSFPDAACSDGRRYGDFAPPGLAGACVDDASGGADAGVDLGGGGGDGGMMPGNITRVGSSSVPAASRTSIALPAPATLAAGDLVFASFLLVDSAVNVTPPAGWTQHADLRGASGGAFHAVWYYRVAAAVEPSSWTFALSASTNATASAVAYRGVDGAAPIDVSTTQQFQGANFVAPSITTTHAGDMLVTMFVQGQSGTLNWHAPTGMQTAADNGPVGIFDATQANAGATGDKQATLGIVPVPGIGAVDYVALTPK